MISRISIIIFLIIITFSGGCTFFPSTPSFDPEPVTLRDTEKGKVVGYIEDNGSHGWMGIPYAKAPVGEHRWQAPKPSDEWKETHEAVEPGPICPQFGGMMGDVSVLDYNDLVGEEDCLFLNIWAPPFTKDNIPEGKKRLPVMLWIHGGGNSVGTGSSYNGKVLAKKYNVIVVSINYRLGPFGWLSHPALREEAGTQEDKSGNFGTLDIIFALKWVRDNIANFGGNPGNVTVFGESAGARNTITMLLSPLAKGLFHRAISQSGAPFTAPRYRGENYRDDKKKGHKNSSREVINRLLIADEKAAKREEAKNYQDKMTAGDIVKYLRGKSAEEIFDAYEPTGMGMISIPQVFRDGHVLLKGDPFKIFKKKKRYNAVPIILGTTRDESKVFMAMDSEYVSFLSGVKDQVYYDMVAKYLSDRWKAVGADEIAITFLKGRMKRVFVYRFDWDEQPPILGRDMGKAVGAGHGLEIPFVFNNFDNLLTGFSFFFSSSNEPGRRALSDSMSSYWAEFAYTGKPGKGRDGKEVQWKPWKKKKGRDKFIVFDTPGDRGIRMSADAVRLGKLKKKILKEKGFKSQKKHCEVYSTMFSNTRLWKDKEYQGLGAEGCSDYPKEMFEW